MQTYYMSGNIYLHVFKNKKTEGQFLKGNMKQFENDDRADSAEHWVAESKKKDLFYCSALLLLQPHSCQ